MQILFIFSLVFAILVSVFAVMNSDPVTIKLLWKQYEFSQAIIILGSAAIGAIIVALLGMVNRVKSSLKVRELQNKIKGLENQLEEFKPADSLDVEIGQNDAADNSEEKIDKPIIPAEEKTENSDEEQI